MLAVEVAARYRVTIYPRSDLTAQKARFSARFHFTAGTTRLMGALLPFAQDRFSDTQQCTSFVKKNMTTTQIKMVQNSWQMVFTADARGAGTLLYQQLMEIVPELKPVLADKPAKESSRKIMALISYIVRKLHKADTINGEVQRMTRRHIHYDVADEQYIKAGRTLLQLLATGLGNQWNREIENAWASCYTGLAEIIMTTSKTHNHETAFYC